MLTCNRLTKRITILLLSFFFAACKLFAQAEANALEFIENKGQWETSVRFKGVLTNGAFFLRKSGFTVVQHNRIDLARLAETAHGHIRTSSENTPVFEKDVAVISTKPGGMVTTSKEGVLHSNSYNVDFIGANENPVIIPEKIQPGYNNYFLGNDSTKWAGGCRLFQSVTYKNMYPGIDVKFYSEYGNLKYEFIVSPGADPSLIAMKFEGINDLTIKNSELIISTSVGEVKELYPYTYQYQESVKVKLDCRYQLSGHTLKFNIKNFSRQSTLIIDPILVFASFTGSTADNWGYTATYGIDGTFFAGGIVFDTGFPVSVGAFQTKYLSASGTGDYGFFNMGIMKFSSNGGQRLYATYIGGNRQDQPHSLFADSKGNLVIAGRTSSANYPTTATFGPLGGRDIVVTKLNAAGTALIGSVRVGGTGDDGYNTGDSHEIDPPSTLINNYGDDARSEVILDAANNIYVASCTMSSDFFTTPNAVQKTLGGVQDAVLLKVDPDCKNVLYSSYLGGKGYDAGFVLSLNPATQDIYMAGGTTSSDFPGNKIGSYQSTFGGGISDGFIAVFSNDGSLLKQTTYVGTNGTDVIFGIQFDKSNFPYIMGITSGSWPIVSIGSTFYSNPNSKQFISKFKKDLSGFVFSTVFGTGSTNPNISPVAFLVDGCENLYVSGWGQDVLGRSYLSSIAGMPVTPDAIKKVPDTKDFYFIVLQRDASKLLYGTFYGQTEGVGEHVDGGTSRFDQQGVIYQAICANCSGGSPVKPQWPVTPGAWCCTTGKSAAGSGGCNLAALKISFNFAGVHAGAKAFINSVFDTTGCVPLAVNFRDTVLSAHSYEWNFGDGSPVAGTDSFGISHTYNAVGTYSVQLIAIDSTTCNIRDTAHTTIIVRDDIAALDFNPVKLNPCESRMFRFDNVSATSPTKPFRGKKFIWDFGDGTRQVAGTESVTHSYAAIGTYKVTLVLNDTSYCNGPDSVLKELRLSPLVKALFEVPPTACAPFSAVFKNNSLAGQSFTWDFGDGTTSNNSNPTHLYSNAGNYVVKLMAVDPGTCNGQDSTQLSLVVQAKPTAVFAFTPTVPQENTPYVFTNTSSANAVRFKWIYGDGDSLITTSRSAIEHQYNSIGTFAVCLVSYNQLGCTDTACTTVQSIVVPKLDVPNAFTPLANNQSNKVFARGFAIAKMKFTIYNRLGQKVFESTDINQGWDGKFKGVIQPMDVYAYTLEAEFSDGTRASKKGDITLIR